MNILYFDGACGPYNPGGHIGCGVVIKDVNGKTIHTISKQFPPERFSGETSNNLAEYTALFMGLQWCLNNNITELHVIGDSKLVIFQMNGIFKIKKGVYVTAANETIKLKEQFKKITFEHVKREFNTEADELSAIIINGYNSKTDKIKFLPKKRVEKNVVDVPKKEKKKKIKLIQPKGKEALNPEKVAKYNEELKKLMEEAKLKRLEKLRLEGNKPNKIIKKIEEEGKKRRESKGNIRTFGLSSNNRGQKRNPRPGDWV
jgi:ribonuclease HI